MQRIGSKYFSHIISEKNFLLMQKKRIQKLLKKKIRTNLSEHKVLGSFALTDPFWAANNQQLPTNAVPTFLGYVGRKRIRFLYQAIVPLIDCECNLSSPKVSPIQVDKRRHLSLKIFLLKTVYITIFSIFLPKNSMKFEIFSN